MKAYTHIRLGIAIMAFILTSGLILCAAAAQGQRSLESPANMKETPVRVPHEKVTIEKKNLETVTTKFGDVYALFVETIIVGADGNQINIRELPVPCSAEILYKSQDGVRKALRIGVVSVYDNATTNWTAKNPG